jgi:hypothetical protein
VTLNLDNKFLETPDGLLAALFGHLFGKVVLGALLGTLLLLASFVLVLL